MEYRRLKNQTREVRLKNNTEYLTFVLRGSLRCEIYQILLSGSRSISELSKKTSKSLSNISRVIKQFESQNLVKKITPSELKGSLYQLTDLALEFKPEFEEHMKFRDTFGSK